MSLIEDELNRLANKIIAVIMTDGKKFRGKLTRFDQKVIVLEDIYELSERQQWVRPIINTTISTTVDQQDVIEQSARGLLNEVILNTRHVIRIWPWEPKNIE